MVVGMAHGRCTGKREYTLTGGTMGLPVAQSVRPIYRLTVLKPYLITCEKTLCKAFCEIMFMQYELIRTIPESEDPSLTIETRDLVVKIIDNTGLLVPGNGAPFFGQEGLFSHRLGYHGIRTLYNKEERRNVVATFVSWLNLQGLSVGGMEPDPVDERSCYGVGRGWPMVLEKTIGGARLRLEPMTMLQMAYSLEFLPTEPDGIDFRVRFRFGKRPEKGPAVVHATWPCYMNGYNDVRLHYPASSAGGGWGWKSLGELPKETIIGEAVGYRHEQTAFYPEDQAHPLGYGVIGEYCLILMFSDPSVRLFCVNTGGHIFSSAVQNPAWDFEWRLEDYPVDREVGFDGRLIYTRFRGADDVVGRYEEWVAERRIV